MKQKIIIVGLIICVGIISIAYYDLNDKYSNLNLDYDELEINHDRAIEMSKICLDDQELCNEIKKRIFESKNLNDLI